MCARDASFASVRETRAFVCWLEPLLRAPLPDPPLHRSTLQLCSLLASAQHQLVLLGANAPCVRDLERMRIPQNQQNSSVCSCPQSQIDAWMDSAADVNVAVPWLWSAIGYSEYVKADVDKAKARARREGLCASAAAALP